MIKGFNLKQEDVGLKCTENTRHRETVLRTFSQIITLGLKCFSLFLLPAPSNLLIKQPNPAAF